MAAEISKRIKTSAAYLSQLSQPNHIPRTGTMKTLAVGMQSIAIMVALKHLEGTDSKVIAVGPGQTEPEPEVIEIKMMPSVETMYTFKPYASARKGKGEKARARSAFRR